MPFQAVNDCWREKKLALKSLMVTAEVVAIAMTTTEAAANTTRLNLCRITPRLKSTLLALAVLVFSSRYFSS
jgi:hypothetical protein